MKARLDCALRAAGGLGDFRNGEFFQKKEHQDFAMRGWKLVEGPMNLGGIVCRKAFLTGDLTTFKVTSLADAFKASMA
jgi:hypothetical protein